MKKYWYYFRLYGSLLIVFLVFHRFFEDFILNTPIIDLLSYATQSCINDLILSVLIFLLLLHFKDRVKKRYKYDISTILNLIMLNIIYLIYRQPKIYEQIFGNLDNETIPFLSTNTFSNIKYFDFIFLLLVISLVQNGITTILTTWKLSIKLKKNNIENTILKRGYLYDEALSDKNPEDLLNRTDIAYEIAEKISNTKSKESSFALGINGEWGSGKSSFIYLIQRHLNKIINKKDRIIINYNPWLSHDIQNIAISFFKTLSQALKPYHSGVSNNITKYARLLVEGSQSKYASIITTVIDHFSAETTLQAEFDKVNETFISLNKQIIIIIDDVDRLDHEEINELLKLIRNSANFANTTFIVAYDRNYLIEALKSLNSYSPYNYLEKIFQHEFILPAIEKDVIPVLIEKSIYPHLKFLHKELFRTVLKSGEKVTEKTFVFRNHIKTIRDAIKFSNGFIFIYNQLKLEISLIDLFNLEVLKFKYPSAYQLLIKYKDDFIKEEYIKEWGKTLKLSGRPDYFLRSEDETKKKSTFENYLIDHSDLFSFHESEIQNIINCINVLLPFYNDDFPAPEDLSINNPDSFERYLHYRILQNDISQSTFDSISENSFETNKEIIDNWINLDKSYQVVTKFENLSLSNTKSQFETIVKAMFYFNRQMSIPGKSNIKINNDKFYLYIESGKKHFNIKKFNEHILKILELAPAPYYFDIEFINYLMTKDTIPFFSAKEIAEGQQIKYFTIFLLEKPKISSLTWQLFYAIKGLNPDQNAINDKARQLLINHIREKDLKGFLQWMIDEDPTNKKQYKLSDTYKKLFYSEDEFNKFLTEFNKLDHPNYLQEFINFFNAFKERQALYIDFNFSFLNITKSN